MLIWNLSRWWYRFIITLLIQRILLYFNGFFIYIIYRQELLNFFHSCHIILRPISEKRLDPSTMQLLDIILRNAQFRFGIIQISCVYRRHHIGSWRVHIVLLIRHALMNWLSGRLLSVQATTTHHIHDGWRIGVEHSPHVGHFLGVSDWIEV